VSDQIPGWVRIVDSLALEALRTHLRIEFDLRAVLRSEGSPENVLTRAEAILERGAEIAIEQLLSARALLIANSFTISEEQSRRLAEQIGGMHLLLLSRISGIACLEIFRKREHEKDAIDFARLAGGILPLVVELERETIGLFEAPRETGISAA